MGIERLPQSRFVEALRDNRRNTLSAKAAQRYGADALVTKRVFSSSTFDIQSSGTSRRIRVTFTPDDVTFGGAPVYRMYARFMNTSNVEVSPLSLRIERQRPEGSTQVWTVYVEHWDTGNWRLKFYFLAIGSGNFVASVLT